MTQFDATLVVGNDPNPIATTVAVSGTSLELSAGGQSLGKWQIADLGMERIFGGYRMNVEGEQAVLKLTDPEPFAEAIEIATGTRVVPKPEPEKKKPRRTKKEKAEPVNAPPAEPARPEQRRRKAQRKTRQAKPAKKVSSAATATEPEAPAGKKDSSVGWLNQKLEQAQQRFGKFLPDWLFTTGGLVIILAVLGMMIAKPVWFSVLFLLIAAVGLITSAIALLDQVVAVRIFRGGFTPIQGMIVSLGIGLVGVLLGSLR